MRIVVSLMRFSPTFVQSRQILNKYFDNHFQNLRVIRFRTNDVWAGTRS